MHKHESKKDWNYNASSSLNLFQSRPFAAQSKIEPLQTASIQAKILEKTIPPFAIHNPSIQLQEIQSIQLQEGNESDGQKQKVNRTGLPDNLKTGIESLSGKSMDEVKVHYNSSKPTQLGASAYTQGTEIHVAPGQEKYLPHEAWHVVQQMQGRVQPTLQLQGAQINDDQELEHEADVMGAKALGSAMQSQGQPVTLQRQSLEKGGLLQAKSEVIQCGNRRVRVTFLRENGL